MGRERPAFRRLGDVPPQGLARGSEPAVRVADQRVVRAADPALRRRRQDVGAGGQQVRLRRRARHAPVVRRHAAPVGVRARLASRTVADRSGHGVRGRRGRGALQVDRRRAELARAVGAAPTRDRLVVAAGRGRHVPAHDPARSEEPAAHLHRDLGRGRVPQRRRGRDVAADQQRPALGTAPRSGRGGRATACTASRCTRRGRTCSSCRSTGT